ncbi:MAG TPA: transposase [Pseudonocardiaceae bacterium]|nr:transposase [Pseudonocardiaceae bacterium]
MALSAFAVRSGEETRQVQMVCVDDLVPADDELRRIERLVDWEHVRVTARPFYKPGGAGRSGIDPAVLVKLALVLAWRGLPSMRATLKLAATDMSIRRFLGFGLTERLPDHSTFSHAQTRRFADSSVFEQLFTAVLRQCVDAGLVGARRLVVDGTHIEADAALKSLRAELTVVARDAGGGADPEAESVADADVSSQPALVLAEPRSGSTPKRVASNATAVSRTDPDAKLRHKPGHRKHLVHRGQVAVDPKARVIIAVQAEHATGSEADALTDLVTRARFAGHSVAELAADSGYASQDSYAALDALKTTALIPPQPAAKHVAAVKARERMRTPTGRDGAFDRQAHAEGAIAELKHHGADRARCRGTRLVQLQLLAAATVINLKRLIAAHDIGQHQQTGDQTSHAATITTLTGLLTRVLNEISRLATTDSSTGS